MNVLQTAAQAVQTPTLVKVDAHSVFPEVYTSPGIAPVSIYNARTERCIAANENFVPDTNLVRMFLSWQQSDRQPLCFGLHGHTGTGKTEFLLWVADRLNLPVSLIQCHGSLLPEDLEGMHQLTNGETIFKLGALLEAYRDGGLVILDELDKINDQVGAFLHGILEGKPITVSQTGETITKHPHCWITATGNTTGEGGSSDYTSSQQLDRALRSRIGWIRVFYPTPSRELDILTATFGSEFYPRSMLRDTIRVAGLLRDAAFGIDEAGTDTPVGVVCSTRTLVNWLYYAAKFGAEQELETSFKYAIGGSIDPESHDEVMAIVQRQMGDAMTKPVGEVIESYTKK